MPFWTYMLHLNGGIFYVGHTDDLERRLAEHQSHARAGYTAGFNRIELAWCESFPTREEAKAAEKRIKGWRREKKLTLIRGDWDGLRALSRGRKEQAFDKLRPDGV